MFRFTTRAVRCSYAARPNLVRSALGASRGVMTTSRTSMMPSLARVTACSTNYSTPLVPVRYINEEAVKDGERLMKEVVNLGTPPLDSEDPTPPHVLALVEETLKLNLIEFMEYKKALQSRLGITDEMLQASMAPAAGSAPVAAAADEGEEEAKEEKQEKVAFTVKLTDLGSGRVKVMKEIRTLTGFGLKEVQSLANNLPAEVGQNLDKEKAEKWAEALKGAGATVEIV